MRVFLTGSPATGKSTLCQELGSRLEGVRIFSFGERMEAHLRDRDSSVRLHDMRKGTLPYVSDDDILTVCGDLVRWMDEHTEGSLSLIDSHQVTIESHGLTLKAFDREILDKLVIDQVWVTASEPQVAIDRMTNDGKGRKIPSQFLASLHDNAQLALAVGYSTRWNCPLHIIENSTTTVAMLNFALSVLPKLLNEKKHII